MKSGYVHPDWSHAAPVVERAVKYNGKVTEYHCRLLRHRDTEIVLSHQLERGFDMRLNSGRLSIPAGTHTVAYYWLDRPYNAYVWIGPDGRRIGTYFNIVGHTSFDSGILCFHDLIIDVIALPSGETETLDEDELPEPLSVFEGGTVLSALKELRSALDRMLRYTMQETSRFYGL